MTTSFDKILKKGKDAAAVTSTPGNTTWEQAIALILHSLQQFNSIYPDPNVHHIAVKHVACQKCKKASFMLMVRSKTNPKQLVKYHLGNWKSTNSDKDEYLCDRCK